MTRITLLYLTPLSDILDHLLLHVRQEGAVIRVYEICGRDGLIKTVDWTDLLEC